ncbi:MAG: hypothetical protein R3C24_01385 [Cyanobacteriota/Melainabacteria group bacterium]
MINRQPGRAPVLPLLPATVLSNTAARINLDSDPEDDIVRVTTTIQIEPLVIVPFILNPLPSACR